MLNASILCPEIMGSFIDHLNQAKHNIACAEEFLDNCDCYDWAVTAAFYAALHFVEAGFTCTPVGHTETHRPSRKQPHTHRLEMVKDHFGTPCWKHFRKLYNASLQVRYLDVSKAGIATDFLKITDARRFVTGNLAEVRKEVHNKSGLDLS